MSQSTISHILSVQQPHTASGSRIGHITCPFLASLIDIFTSIEIEISLCCSHCYLPQGPLLFKSNASALVFIHSNSPPFSHLVFTTYSVSTKCWVFVSMYEDEKINVIDLDFQELSA